MKSFKIARLPYLIFGQGRLETLTVLLKEQSWKKVILFTGSGSFRTSNWGNSLLDSLKTGGIKFTHYFISGEPSPELVDRIAEENRQDRPDACISVGGGSVIDTGKAVSAMLKASGSIEDYLEGVGTRKPTGKKLPFIAVPTTSGTGAEATKNAVISRVGENGFKKSFRHDNYVPDFAVIDPELILSCPPDISAYSGLDAITQLVEAFVSSTANPFTDALVRSALHHAGKSFPRAVRDGERDLQARADMAYSAYISGIALANAGLGVVHGIAGALGGLFPVPHGVVCGTLIGAATDRIIERLFENPSANKEAIEKYAEAGRILGGSTEDSASKDCALLVRVLNGWINEFKVPRLSAYGIDTQAVGLIAAKSGIKNTPLELDKEDIKEILKARL